MVMGSGNGTAKTLVQWLLGILGVLVTAVIIGGATASIATRVDVGIIKAEQVMMKTDIMFLKAEVSELDDKLDARMLENRGPPNGGGEGSR